MKQIPFHLFASKTEEENVVRERERDLTPKCFWTRKKQDKAAETGGEGTHDIKHPLGAHRKQ